MALTLTVGLPNYGAAFAPGEWHRFLDLGRAADDVAIDRVVVVDHVVMGNHTDAYAWGRFPVPPEAPWLEPITMVAALAAVTRRVRLATGILIAPLRPAVLLAKQAATLDVLSQGRLDLGVGTGWQREEYDAEGLDFAQRGRLLTDTLAALKALWRDTPASVMTPTISFDDIYCEPKPAQPGGVPLWIAGTLNRANLERVVLYGDAWIPIMGATIDEIAQGGARIRDAWAAAGRDPGALQVQAPLPMTRADDGTPSIARSMEAVPALAAAGVTNVQVASQALDRDPARAAGHFGELARRFHDVAG